MWQWGAGNGAKAVIKGRPGSALYAVLRSQEFIAKVR